MSKWIGYAVSVKCCEPLGCYQGTIVAADGSTITLTKAFRNGFPYPKSQVTLNAADIKDLKIIEERVSGPGGAQQAHSTVPVSKTSKKASRATVCENLQANPSSSGNQHQQSQNNGSNVVGVSGGGSGHNQHHNQHRAAPPTSAGGGSVTRTKPIDIQAASATRNTKANAHANTGGGGGGRVGPAGGSGGPGTWSARHRNEACFGSQAEPGTSADFDFEGNLALFDKRALWDQMNSQKPDLVRQTDEAKYRHDENVLGGGGGGAGGGGCYISGRGGYVTDAGGYVGGGDAMLRRTLWCVARDAGLLEGAGALLARAACEVMVRVVGGCRRLEARNMHQAPSVCILAAPTYHSGAAALMAARLLADHNVKLKVYLRPGPQGRHIAPVSAEVRLLSASGVRVMSRVDQLDEGGSDAVLVGLHALGLQDEDNTTTNADDNDVTAAEASWLANTRAAIVGIEPRDIDGVSYRACIYGLIPPQYEAVRAARVYLVSVGAPPSMYSRVGVSYRAPFGAHSLLPLHPATQDECDTHLL